MGKTKVVVSGVVWTVINSVASIIYGIISVPFLINYCGKEEFGLIGLALSVNVYIQLLDMGMTNSNVRFFSEFLAKKESDNVQKLFSLTHLLYLILGIINSVILFGLSFFVDELFKVTPDQAIILRNLIWILAANATFSWLSVCFNQFIRANELIDWIKKQNVFLKLSQFIVLAAVIVFKLSIEFYFFGYIFVTTIILPLSLLKTKRLNKKLAFNFRFDKKMFNTIFPYAISFFSFGIFQFLTSNSRPLLIANMCGSGAVADFVIMSTIASVVTMLSGSFMQVLLPIVTKMSVLSDWKSINKLLNDGTKYVSIVLSIIIFLLIISIKEIFTLYVGEEYIYLSKWMILWLITLLLSHRNVMTSLVFTKKKLTSVVIMGATSMILAIIAYIIFVPIYGAGGVVIGYAIHELVHTLFYYIYFLPRKFQINTKSIFFHSVLPTWLVLGGACVVVTFVLSSVHCSILLLAILKVGILGIVMLILVWTVLLNTKDKIFLRSFLLKTKRVI